MTVEVLIKAGYEGGSITLYWSIDPRGGDRYYVQLNQVALLDLLDEGDEGLLTSPTVPTFEEAFAIFNRRPDWAYCTPLVVTPDVAARVFAAVEAHHERRLDVQALQAWREACR